MRWWDVVTGWLRDRPPRPDPKGQAAKEQVQDVVIQSAEEHAEQVIQALCQSDPALLAEIEAAARRRKLDLEKRLILREHRGHVP